MTTAIGTALVLGYGAYHALQGRLSVGQLLVVMTYVAAVYKPLEAISTTIGSLQDQIVSLQITFDLLDTEPEIQDVKGAHTFVRAWGHVTFKNVHFSYAGRVGTLKGINFEVRPGQKIALVGPTGAGKTTLISLIPRFYDPSHGRIEIDGVDIRKVTLKSLRQSVSLVQQEPLLFSDTISNNIRYGRLEATMDEIVAAARAANAHDFIMGLPEQYETVDRRAWGQAVRRRAPADLGRPRLPQGRPDPAPRRADLLDRLEDRGRHPRRARSPHGGADDLHGGAPPLHHPRRGSDPGRESRADRRVGNP